VLAGDGTLRVNNAKWHLELRLKEIARREEEERQRKVEQETTRERDIEECCRRLEDAKDVGWYKPDIIEEARRRIGAEDLGGY
jgi:Fe-S oxidoreductase